MNNSGCFNCVYKESLVCARCGKCYMCCANRTRNHCRGCNVTRSCRETCRLCLMCKSRCCKCNYTPEPRTVYVPKSWFTKIVDEPKEILVALPSPPRKQASPVPIGTPSVEESDEQHPLNRLASATLTIVQPPPPLPQPLPQSSVVLNPIRYTLVAQPPPRKVSLRQKRHYVVDYDIDNDACFGYDDDNDGDYNDAKEQDRQRKMRVKFSSQ